MLAQLDAIIQRVETLLRGGNQNAVALELYNLSRDMLLGISTSSISEMMEETTEQAKVELVTAAVKLHNKGRNLTAQSLAEVRSILKASAGWILSIFGGDKPKVLSIVITLLTKAGQELIQHGKDGQIGSSCLSRAIYTWTRATSLAIQKDISPIDWQDMKMSVFWAYLEQISLLHLSTDSQELKRAIAGATEIVQTLPPLLKVTFARRVNDLAHKATQIEDAVQLCKTALHVVDDAMLPYTVADPDSAPAGGTNQANTADTKRLRLEIQLALVFFYLHARFVLSYLCALESIQLFPVPFQRVLHGEELHRGH